HLLTELLRDHKAAGRARAHLLIRRGLAIKLLVHQALVVRVETHGVQELANRLKLPLRLRTTRRETLALSNRRPRSVEMRFERFQLLSSLDVLGQLLDLGLLSVVFRPLLLGQIAILRRSGVQDSAQPCDELGALLPKLLQHCLTSGLMP